MLLTAVDERGAQRCICSQPSGRLRKRGRGIGDEHAISVTDPEPAHANRCAHDRHPCCPSLKEANAHPRGDTDRDQSRGAWVIEALG